MRDCVMYVRMHVCAGPLIEGEYYEVPARQKKKEIAHLNFYASEKKPHLKEDLFIFFIFFEFAFFFSFKVAKRNAKRTKAASTLQCF